MLISFARAMSDRWANSLAFTPLALTDTTTNPWRASSSLRWS
ncbi:hypothetical protein ACWEIJ_29590 [Lentzea sp. NPDC004789]